MSINNKLNETVRTTAEKKNTELEQGNQTETHVWQYQQISLPYTYLLRALDTRRLECLPKNANCCQQQN